MKAYQLLLTALIGAIALTIALFSSPDHVVDGSALPIKSSGRLSPQFDGRDTSGRGAYFRSRATGLWMYRTDTPSVPSRKAAVVLVHGFSEHHERSAARPPARGCSSRTLNSSCRYSHVIEQLSKSGYSVHGYDHQGHGRSEGTRGRVASHSPQSCIFAIFDAGLQLCQRFQDYGRRPGSVCQRCCRGAGPPPAALPRLALSC